MAKDRLNMLQSTDPIVPPTPSAIERLEDRIIASDYRYRALDSTVLRKAYRVSPDVGISSTTQMVQLGRRQYRVQPGVGRASGPPEEVQTERRSRRIVPGVTSSSTAAVTTTNIFTPKILQPRPACLPPATMVRPPRY